MAYTRNHKKTYANRDARSKELYGLTYGKSRKALEYIDKSDHLNVLKTKGGEASGLYNMVSKLSPSAKAKYTANQMQQIKFAGAILRANEVLTRENAQNHQNYAESLRFMKMINPKFNLQDRRKTTIIAQSFFYGVFQQNIKNPNISKKTLQNINFMKILSDLSNISAYSADTASILDDYFTQENILIFVSISYDT
jgi:hypothetical protein